MGADGCHGRQPFGNRGEASQPSRPGLAEAAMSDGTVSVSSTSSTCRLATSDFAVQPSELTVSHRRTVLRDIDGLCEVALHCEVRPAAGSQIDRRRERQAAA